MMAGGWTHGVEERRRARRGRSRPRPRGRRGPAPAPAPARGVTSGPPRTRPRRRSATPAPPARRWRDPPRPGPARPARTARPGRTRAPMSVGDGRAGRPGVRVDDRPEHLVGVVGRDRQAEQIVGVDRRSGAATRPRSGWARIAGRPPPSAAGASPTMTPHASLGYSARAWATIAARMSAGRRGRRPGMRRRWGGRGLRAVTTS